jgi:hypothetical protein
VLRRVHPNSANLFHGRFPLSEICNDLILARSMPSGAVHSNRFPAVSTRIMPLAGLSKANRDRPEPRSIEAGD